MTKEDLIKEFDRLITAHYEEEIDSRDEWLREIISLKDDVVKKLIIYDVSNSFIVNGFVITQQKNLHPTILSWQAKHLIKDITFQGKTKKECISWSKNYC